MPRPISDWKITLGHLSIPDDRHMIHDIGSTSSTRMLRMVSRKECNQREETVAKLSSHKIHYGAIHRAH